MSRKTGIPVSTIFDRIKDYEKRVIKRHTSLLDFDQLGFDVMVHFILKVNSSAREPVRDFLMRNFRVNSFFRINNGYDFMVEAVFSSMIDYQQFCDKLDSAGVKKKHEYFVLKEFKREDFLTSSAGFEYAGD
ncbi:MAG: Lrp/AsnC family transcriptional regulator [Nanobdellota archaeon]